MYYLLPDYYQKFTCSADKCQDNCCIGWEIMVDDVAWERYQTLPNGWSERFRHCIADEPNHRHFILQEGRCPFLNANQRCEIILHFGEEALCDICDEHPRFTFEAPGWMETGLGLCCEEAARLILTSQEPAAFLCGQSPDDAPPTPLPPSLQKLLERRWKLFALLQNRDYSLQVRFQALLTAEQAGKMPDSSEFLAFIDFLQGQDYLTPEWPTLLAAAHDFLQLSLEKQAAVRKEGKEKLDNASIEYEQLAIYFLFRYYVTSFFDQQPALKARLSIVAVCFLQTMALAEYVTTSVWPDLDRRLRLAQIFSKEVEYNDETLEGFQELIRLGL